MGSAEDRLVQEVYRRLNIGTNDGVLTYNDPIQAQQQEDSEAGWQNCIVGRLLTEKVINFQIFQNMMACIWKPGKGMMVKELGNNCYLFQFFHELDVEKVIDGGPWNYQQIPIILHELQPNENPRRVELTKLLVWVQIHNVPSGYQSEQVVKDVGNFLGEYVASDPRNYMRIWRDFMRVRVFLDVRVPIKRDIIIQRPNCPDVCFNFEYERLNTFCYFCGIIGHGDRNCKLLYDMPKIPKERYPYGPWLKADSKKVKHSGAKWLRSERDILQSSRSQATPVDTAGYFFQPGQTSAGQGNSDKDNHIPIPSNQGIFSTNNANQMGKEGDNGGIAAHLNIQTGSILLTDPKRRRTDDVEDLDTQSMEDDVIPETNDLGSKNSQQVGSEFGIHPAI